MSRDAMRVGQLRHPVPRTASTPSGLNRNDVNERWLSGANSLVERPINAPTTRELLIQGGPKSQHAKMTDTSISTRNRCTVDRSRSTCPGRSREADCRLGRCPRWGAAAFATVSSGSRRADDDQPPATISTISSTSGLRRTITSWGDSPTGVTTTRSISSHDACAVGSVPPVGEAVWSDRHEWLRQSEEETGPPAAEQQRRQRGPAWSERDEDGGGYQSKGRDDPKSGDHRRVVTQRDVRAFGRRVRLVLHHRCLLWSLRSARCRIDHTPTGGHRSARPRGASGSRRRALARWPDVGCLRFGMIVTPHR